MEVARLPAIADAAAVPPARGRREAPGTRPRRGAQGRGGQAPAQFPTAPTGAVAHLNRSAADAFASAVKAIPSQGFASQFPFIRAKTAFARSLLPAARSALASATATSSSSPASSF